MRASSRWSRRDGSLPWSCQAGSLGCSATKPSHPTTRSHEAQVPAALPVLGSLLNDSSLRNSSGDICALCRPASFLIGSDISFGFVSLLIQNKAQLGKFVTPCNGKSLRKGPSLPRNSLSKTGVADRIALKGNIPRGRAIRETPCTFCSSDFSLCLCQGTSLADQFHF